MSDVALAEALQRVLRENPDLPSVSDVQRAALVRHGELLARWNRVHNLTRLERSEEVARRHFADSLAGLAALERHLSETERPGAAVARLADVGSGGGFPGAVAAVLWPQREVVLVEAARKRASFLGQVARELGLGNLRVDNRREGEVEAASFDAVLTRATLQWPELPRLGRLLRPDGWLAAWVAEEPTEAQWQERLQGTGLGSGSRRAYSVHGLPERGILLARRST